MLIAGTRLEYTESDEIALDYYLDSKEKWGLRVWNDYDVETAQKFWAEKKKNRITGIKREIGSGITGTDAEILKKIKALPCYCTRKERDANDTTPSM